MELALNLISCTKENENKSNGVETMDERSMKRGKQVA
jgi:hypothetical protein